MKEQDCLRRFLFEDLGIRGEWVNLTESWQASKQHQNLPSVVQEQLGQALAASVLLSATIKFAGSLILQAQGSGGLKALVAQCTHDRKIRGLARYDPELMIGTVTEMMGQGRLVITVEPEQGEPYQGLIDLAGQSLADDITRYFLQSEQLTTQVWLCANEFHAVGLFLQQLPDQENVESDWEHIITLANTVTEQELLTLDSEQILYRLFNQERILLFNSESVSFSCSCSRQKIVNTLITLGQDELQSILDEQGIIDVNCEFCNEQYAFNAVDITTILSEIK